MMQRTDTQQEWKVVEDAEPAVDGAVGDALTVRYTVPTTTNTISIAGTAGGGKLRKLWLGVAAVALGAIYVAGGALVSGLGMDWGYYLVKALVGQARDDFQWVGAIWLQCYVAPAIFGAMVIALSKRLLGGRKIWWFVLATPLLASLGAAVVMLEEEAYTALPMIFAVWTLLLTCYRAFDWVAAELIKRTHAVRLMLCPLIAFVPVVALDLADKFVENSGESQLSLAISIASYVLICFASAAAVPHAVKTRSVSAAIAASIFSFLPMLVFCVTNIAFATIFLHDWHATLSASIIMLVTLAATTGGVAFGCAIRRN